MCAFHFRRTFIDFGAESLKACRPNRSQSAPPGTVNENHGPGDLNDANDSKRIASWMDRAQRLQSEKANNQVSAVDEHPASQPINSCSTLPSATSALSFVPQTADSSWEPQHNEMIRLNRTQPNSCMIGKDDPSKDVATTLMIRNLPFSLTCAQLEQAVDASGFANLHDFVYLPHKWNKSLGFAFINFVDAEVAQKFTSMWNKSKYFKSKAPKGLKQLNVSAATIQGRTAEQLQAYLDKVEIGKTRK